MIQMIPVVIWRSTSWGLVLCITVVAMWSNLSWLLSQIFHSQSVCIKGRAIFCIFCKLRHWATWRMNIITANSVTFHIACVPGFVSFLDGIWVGWQHLKTLTLQIRSSTKKLTKIIWLRNVDTRLKTSEIIQSGLSFIMLVYFHTWATIV